MKSTRALMAKFISIIFLSLFLVSFSACAKSKEFIYRLRIESMEPVLSDLIVSRQSSGEKILIKVEIVDSPTERERGFMYRTSLEENYGMFFIFQEEAPRKFWMRNTKIPLDMIFVDKELNIIGIVEGAKPCKKDPCPTYGPDQPAQYVLEVNKGFIDEHGITVGDMIELP